MPTCFVRMTLNSRLSKHFPPVPAAPYRQRFFCRKLEPCVFGAYRPRNSSVTERRENLIIPKTAAAVAATAANASNAR